MSDESICSDSICNKLRAISNTIYIEKLKEYSSLKLYTELKSRVCREQYLSNVHNEFYRKVLTCLRLSCHRLPIVTGRYNNLEINDRKCIKCKMTVGSEYHCIMECFDQHVVKIRNEFLTTIFNINPSFKYLNRPTLFKYIMLFTDKTILNASSKFIFEIHSLYN